MTFADRFAVMSARGPGFDLIRLAAALTVIAHHAWWGVDDAIYRYSYKFMQAGLLAVIVFFCISGFLVAPGLVRSGVARFAVHRAARIFPALIVVVLGSMFVVGPLLTTYPLVEYFADPELYLYFKNAATLMANHLPGVVREGHPVTINGALWTLNIEVYSYAALAVLSVLGILRRRALTLALWAAVYLAYVGLAILPSLSAVCPPRFSIFISLFVYFLAGVNLYLYADKIPFSGLQATIALFLVVIGLPLGIGAVVMPFCVPYILVYLGLSDLLSRVRLKHDVSYGLYLIHSPVIWVLMFALGLGSSWLLAVLAISVTLLLAYMSWIFVEGPVLSKKASISNWVQRRLEMVSPMLSSGNRVHARPAE